MEISLALSTTTISLSNETRSRFRNRGRFIWSPGGVPPLCDGRLCPFRSEELSPMSVLTKSWTKPMRFGLRGSLMHGNLFRSINHYHQRSEKSLQEQAAGSFGAPAECRLFVTGASFVHFGQKSCHRCQFSLNHGPNRCVLDSEGH